MLFCPDKNQKNKKVQISKCQNDRQEEACSSGQKSTSSTAFSRGSVTIEAAFGLPVMIMVIIAVYTFFSVIGLELRMKQALTEAGKRTAAYYAAVERFRGEEEKQESLMAALGERILWAAVSETLIRAMVEEEFGEGPGNTLLQHGFDSVSYAGTHFDEDHGDLVIRADMRCRIPFLPSALSFVLSEQSVIKAWTGKPAAASGQEQETYVYVTEYGSVYHLSPACRTIALSVHTAAAGEAGSLRNADGACYYPCEYCGQDGGELVYYTGYGTRYHYSGNCTALKRNVRRVRLSEVRDLPACKVCGAA